ncbi:MAG TPA: carboxymuconolactone decarboxylase family protein [Desulfuromonadaceae bacterium]
MELNAKIRELIAIGASITANCQPCLASHAEKALGFGACPEEVAAAIEIGNRVRKGAAARMEAFATSFQREAPSITMGAVTEAGGRQFLGP